MSLCKLCQKNRSLRNSHISPKFIADWIRNTSVTRKMRRAVVPNKRVQDAEKVKLLCKECEGLFSRLEKYFSENIFKPVIDLYTPVVKYDHRLLKFAVSLSWRQLAVSMQGCPWKVPAHKLAAQKAEKRWREFLLRDVDLNGYEHHLLMLRLVTGAPKIGGTNVNINWYFFRSIDGTIVQNFKEAFIYVKLPGFVFISPLKPEPFGHMVNTLIEKTGKMEFYEQRSDQSIFRFLVERSVEGLSPMATISKRQKAKIEADYYKDENRVQNSYGFKLFLAELGEGIRKER
ncbi:hypothetical protein ES707_01372 [subsurface metagenome]